MPAGESGSCRSRSPKIEHHIQQTRTRSGSSCELGRVSLRSGGALLWCACPCMSSALFPALWRSCGLWRRFPGLCSCLYLPLSFSLCRCRALFALVCRFYFHPSNYTSRVYSPFLRRFSARGSYLHSVVLLQDAVSPCLFSPQSKMSLPGDGLSAVPDRLFLRSLRFSRFLRPGLFLRFDDIAQLVLEGFLRLRVAEGLLWG